MMHERQESSFQQTYAPKFQGASSPDSQINNGLTMNQVQGAQNIAVSGGKFSGEVRNMVPEGRFPSVQGYSNILNQQYSTEEFLGQIPQEQFANKGYPLIGGGVDNLIGGPQIKSQSGAPIQPQSSGDHFAQDFTSQQFAAQQVVSYDSQNMKLTFRQTSSTSQNYAAAFLGCDANSSGSSVLKQAQAPLQHLLMPNSVPQNLNYTMSSAQSNILPVRHASASTIVQCPTAVPHYQLQNAGSISTNLINNQQVMQASGEQLAERSQHADLKRQMSQQYSQKSWSSNKAENAKLAAAASHENEEDGLSDGDEDMEDDEESENAQMTNNGDANNNGNAGRWTDEEHERFLEALKIYGKNWNKVHRYVGTRTSAQTRSHAQKYFNKLVKKNTKEAQDELKELNKKGNRSEKRGAEASYPSAQSQTLGIFLNQQENNEHSMGSINQQSGSFSPNVKGINEEINLMQAVSTNQLGQQMNIAIPMLNQINSTDEDGQDEDDDGEMVPRGSIEGSDSSGGVAGNGGNQNKMGKSKAIKKKLGIQSKSPKILPSMPPQNVDPFGTFVQRDNLGLKKSKHNANVMRVRKDSHLSEKERRKQEINGGKVSLQISTTLQAQMQSQQSNQSTKLFEVIKCPQPTPIGFTLAPNQVTTIKTQSSSPLQQDEKGSQNESPILIINTEQEHPMDFTPLQEKNNIGSSSTLVKLGNHFQISQLQQQLLPLQSTLLEKSVEQEIIKPQQIPSYFEKNQSNFDQCIAPQPVPLVSQPQIIPYHQQPNYLDQAGFQRLPPAMPQQVFFNPYQPPLYSDLMGDNGLKNLRHRSQSTIDSHNVYSSPFIRPSIPINGIQIHSPENKRAAAGHFEDDFCAHSILEDPADDIDLIPQSLPQLGHSMSDMGYFGGANSQLSLQQKLEELNFGGKATQWGS